MARDTDLSDAALVRRVHDGDASAFRVLCERHEARVTAFIRHRLPHHLRRKVSASDLMLDAETTAFLNSREFEGLGENCFGKWLTRIAERKVRETLRYYRRQKRAAHREITHGRRIDTPNVAGADLSPSQEAILGERAEQVHEALGRLSEDYREVLRLVFERRLTHREVAERMGRSQEAIKKLYGRALCRFKLVFEDLEGGGDA